MEIEKHLWLRGMSQKTIAQELGISGAFLSEICSGKADMPIRLILPFAALTGLALEDIITAFVAIRKAYKEMDQ